MSLPNRVELITFNDWQVLRVDNAIFYEGHNIPDFIWLEVLSHWVDTNHVFMTEELTEDD